MQVHVAKGDITLMPVDAIVCPSRSRGLMHGGVAGDIRRLGGDLIQAEAVESAPIAVGAAIVTGAGRLHAGAVIHAPTMEDASLKIGIEHVRRAARAALLAAVVREFQVIAIPGMGTGGGQVDKDEAARTIVDELRALKNVPLHTVYLVDLDDDMIMSFEEACRNALQGF